MQKDEAGQPIGSKTARLLTAASSPFGTEPGSAARSMLPTARPAKRRTWPLAAAVLLFGSGISFYAARTTQYESVPSLGASSAPQPPVILDAPRAPTAPPPVAEPDQRIAALPEIELTLPEPAQRKRMPVPARLRLQRQELAPAAEQVRPRKLEDVRLEVRAAPSIEANLEERELTSRDILRLGL